MPDPKYEQVSLRSLFWSLLREKDDLDHPSMRTATFRHRNAAR